MKKLFVWILSATLCVSLAACAGKTPSVPADGTQESAESANDAVTAAYQDKVAELEAESGEALSWVSFPCGTGEKILVVTKESSIYVDGATMEADVYQYADGEVKFIASVSSTGTAYPLAYTEEAVLFGGNHTAGKLVVHDGAGELYQLVNMNIEGRMPVLETYDAANGEITLKSSEELSPEEADLFDYYTNAFAEEKAEVIGFIEETPKHNALPLETLQTLFTGITGYQGKAGSALRNAQGACNLLAFAEGADYANISLTNREEIVSGAYLSMSDEQREEFSSNFADILDFMESAFSDYASVRGVFDDGGVADTMDSLMEAENAREQWDALSSDIWAVAGEYSTD